MQFNDEDLKIIKEADIAGDAIPYLRSDKTIKPAKRTCPCSTPLAKEDRYAAFKNIKNRNLYKTRILIFDTNDLEMDIQTEKIELAKLLLNTNNPKIIQSIKQIFKKEKTADFWDELTSDQKKEIKTARKEIKDEKSSDYESFMTKHR